MDDKDAHAETIAWLQVEAEREGLHLKAVYDASLWASVYLQVHVWAPGPKVWRPTTV